MAEVASSTSSVPDYESLSEQEKRALATKVSLAAMIGTAIEFYDFFIYGVAASLIFREQFFPQLSPVVGTAVSIATFAVAYITRPLGAGILSNFGDKYGRKNMLVLSMMIMGLSTFAIGLLPNAASIGYAAPLLLIGLRLLQGFGVGAEQSGAIVMATEFAPKGRRGLYAGLASSGVAAGVVVANLAFLILNLSASPEWVKAVGWRIPFMFSIVLVGVGLYLRLRVDETPVFRALREAKRQRAIPMIELFKNHWWKLIQVILLTMFLSSIGYTGLVFGMAYATTQLHMAPIALLGCTIVANLLEVPATIYFASLSDRVGRKRVFLSAVAVGLLFAPAVFPLINTATVLGFGIAIVGLRLITAAMYGPQGAIFSEMFNTEVRYSGVALGFAISQLVSALTVSVLFAGTAGDTTLPTLYMCGSAVVSFLIAMTIVERRDRDLKDQSA